MLFDILTWTAVIFTLLGYILVSKKIINGYSWSFQISTLIARVAFLIVNTIRQTYSFALMDLVFLVICVSTMYQLYNDSLKKPTTLAN
jgi:hypothetical protein